MSGHKIARRGFLGGSLLAAAALVTGCVPAAPTPAPTATPAPSPWSVRTADTLLHRHPPSSTRWCYEHGLMLWALLQAWLRTGSAGYLRFVKECLAPLIGPKGRIRGYSLEEHNLDQVLPGRALFHLYRETGDAGYRAALSTLRRQLRTQPRTAEGGFWHKRIYPQQMWLDGVYMSSPFLAEYAVTFSEPEALDDVAHQVLLIEQHTRDPGTGLLYHGWDEARAQRWASPETGCSPSFWGRAMGWYAMAVVDVLDYLPPDHPRRNDILAVLGRLADAVSGVQDGPTGLWYQVLDQGGREGNYLEASASAMFVYALAKGVRLGYLESGRRDAARRGYQGLITRLVRVDGEGWVHLEGTCSVAGLGGSPYRDGSYAYYVGEPIVADDYKGVAPFILASLEMERSGAIAMPTDAPAP